jgi:lycopene cyclase domain-containing protein
MKTSLAKPLLSRMSERWKWPILALPYLLIALRYFLDTVEPDPLVYEVPNVTQLPFLETHWAYALLHLFAFVPVFLLSFDRKVHYYTEWKFLFPAILIMGGFFIGWDAYKTIVGVWGFNEHYITKGSLLYLPWEEWMFFLTVPFASIFIYECLNAYFPRDPLQKWDKAITLGLIGSCFLLALITIDKTYSSITFILTGGFLLYHWLYVPNTYRTLFYRAFLVILVPFLLVDGVLTGGFTQEPIIVYNPSEFMGIRLVSIPIEDAVYGFLHLFGVCYWMEWLRKGDKSI